GRGGDHSELGAVDAEQFCLEHGLSPYDARLVSWLVKHHLLLSVTAQKKDINDPEVIRTFAETVGDQLHLDYLYLLTVADVRGTTPRRCGTSGGRGCRELYEQTRTARRGGLARRIAKEELTDESKQAARARLLESGFDGARLDALWANFSDEYFLRHGEEE